jgi:hypothetical protein
MQQRVDVPKGRFLRFESKATTRDVSRPKEIRLDNPFFVGITLPSLLSLFHASLHPQPLGAETLVQV